MPSNRYYELIDQYVQLHNNKKGYGSKTLKKYLNIIDNIVRKYKVKSILDYGCGKAILYEEMKLQDRWNVNNIALYDPAIKEYENLPHDHYDLVLSTDVMEHLPEEDVDWVISKMFSKAKKIVFAAICVRPAAAILPNGENAHCTVKPPRWWNEKFQKNCDGKPFVLDFNGTYTEPI